MLVVHEELEILLETTRNRMVSGPEWINFELHGGGLQYCTTFYTYIGKMKINIIITGVSQIAKYIV